MNDNANSPPIWFSRSPTVMSWCALATIRREPL